MTSEGPQGRTSLLMPQFSEVMQQATKKLTQVKRLSTKLQNQTPSFKERQRQFDESVKREAQKRIDKAQRANKIDFKDTFFDKRTVT